jgi:hypothetical protein
MRKIILTLTAILLTLIALNSVLPIAQNLMKSGRRSIFLKRHSKPLTGAVFPNLSFIMKFIFFATLKITQRILQPEYERAYILYKQKKINQSELFFNTILEKYETSPYAYLYPQPIKSFLKKFLPR